MTVIPTSTSAGRATRLLVDQIRSIDVDYLEDDPVDYLQREEMAEVELALAHYLGVQQAGPQS